MLYILIEQPRTIRRQIVLCIRKNTMKNMRMRMNLELKCRKEIDKWRKIAMMRRLCTWMKG